MLFRSRVKHEPLFTQPVKAGNVASLCRLAVLCQRHGHGMGGHCCNGNKLASKSVTEPNQCLCKRDSWHAEIMHSYNNDDVTPQIPVALRLHAM